MSFYSGADQLYACIGALFERVLEKFPSIAQTILASRMIIRLRCAEPRAEITLDGRRAPVQAIRGASPLRPDLNMELDGDTLHFILLGELPIKRALAGGQLKVKGQIWKAPALVDLLHQGQALYSDVLREQGLLE